MPTSTLNLRLFDGSRQLFPPQARALITITDGNQKQIMRRDLKGNPFTIKGIPFYDNLGDNYSVIAYVSGYKQSGYAPIKLSPAAPVTVDLMLIPDDPVFNFAGLTLDRAKQKIPFLAGADGEDDNQLQERYSRLMEDNGSKSLACMLNLVAAMQAINLGGKSPVDYIHQVRWDYQFPAQDRFFAYCDSALIDAVRAAAARGEFDPEYGAGLVHPGASLSWKQNALPEANVQLTFHTDPIDCVPSKSWVTVEPDVDYYKNLLDHTILEVTRNELTGSLTDPAQVFVLRWTEDRRLNLPEFDPGYTIRSA